MPGRGCRHGLHRGNGRRVRCCHRPRPNSQNLPSCSCEAEGRRGGKATERAFARLGLSATAGSSRRRTSALVTSVLAHGSVLLAALVVLQRTTPPRPPAEVTVALQFVQPERPRRLPHSRRRRRLPPKPLCPRRQSFTPQNPFRWLRSRPRATPPARAGGAVAHTRATSRTGAC